MTQVECRTLYGQQRAVPRDELVFRPSAYAIIVNDGKILLTRMRSTGDYALPGGGVDVGERLEEALKREVREETGIEIAVERFVHFQEDFFYYDPTGRAFHGLLFFYICRPTTVDLVADDQVDDDEVEQPRWIAVADLAESDVHRGHRAIVFDTLRRQEDHP